MLCISKIISSKQYVKSQIKPSKSYYR